MVVEVNKQNVISKFMYCENHDEFMCSFDEQLAMAKSELISAITRYRENILMRDTKNRAELEVELEKKFHTYEALTSQRYC